MRDTSLFALGLLILARQAGIFFDPPSQVSIPLLTVGALMCNVPGLLQVIAWRSGVSTGPASSLPGSSPSEQRPGSSSAQLSGGDR